MVVVSSSPPEVLLVVSTSSSSAALGDAIDNDRRNAKGLDHPVDKLSSGRDWTPTTAMETNPSNGSENGRRTFIVQLLFSN